MSKPSGRPRLSREISRPRDTFGWLFHIQRAIDIGELLKRLLIGQQKMPLLQAEGFLQPFTQRAAFNLCAWRNRDTLQIGLTKQRSTAIARRRCRVPGSWIGRVSPAGEAGGLLPPHPRERRPNWSQAATAGPGAAALFRARGRRQPHARPSASAIPAHCH
jgi:hypothetical protein